MPTSLVLPVRKPSLTTGELTYCPVAQTRYPVGHTGKIRLGDMQRGHDDQRLYRDIDHLCMRMPGGTEAPAGSSR
jgi:hypothetical protein